MDRYLFLVSEMVMNELVHHPSFKKLCGICGAIKFVVYVGGVHWKRCPNCDYAEIPDMKIYGGQ